MESKKVHLNHLLNEVEYLSCSDHSIFKLMELIESEYDKEWRTDPDMRRNYYLNNLRQTKDKQLDELLQNLNKNKKRKELFDRAKSHFQQDITAEMRRLNYSE